MEEDLSTTFNQIRLSIENFKKKFDIKADKLIGCWGLISCTDIEDLEESEMNTILILTEDDCFLIDYDDSSDSNFNYRLIELKSLISIELGILDNSTFFSTGKKPCEYCVQIESSLDSHEVFYHTFRSANFHLFSNVVTAMNSNEEKFGKKSEFDFVKKSFENSFELAKYLKVC